MLVKQAANVLELMEYFAERKKPSTLAQIADDLNWPRSSTFNIVGTLADRGYLYEPKPRGGYYPSPRWLAIAQAVGEAEPLPEAVHEAVADIARQTGETTAVDSAAGTSVILLHVIESRHPLRYFARIGTLVPIQACSAGRALLAQFTQQERRALYKKIKFRALLEDQSPQCRGCRSGAERSGSTRLSSEQFRVYRGSGWRQPAAPVGSEAAVTRGGRAGLALPRAQTKDGQDYERRRQTVSGRDLSQPVRRPPEVSTRLDILSKLVIIVFTIVNYWGANAQRHKRPLPWP